MKTKTTMKYIKANYAKVFHAGYCALQYIMAHTEPEYYNTGVYGWNCDIYVDYKRDIAITTGYRNMCGILIPSDLEEKYSTIAKVIIQNQFNRTYEEVKTLLDQNRENFFDELENL